MLAPCFLTQKLFNQQCYGQNQLISS